MSEKCLVPSCPKEDTKLETKGLGSLSGFDLVQAAASSQDPVPSSECETVSLSPRGCWSF